MAIATYDDANLLLKLYDLRREEKLRAARAWFVKNVRLESMEDFQRICAPGTPENGSFRQVVSYWDMVASLITNGILHADLFFQNNRELLLVWVRIHKFVPSLRTAFADPTAYSNLEKVAKQYVEWMNQRDPGIYPAFADRIK